jgi:hypothetical protein
MGGMLAEAGMVLVSLVVVIDQRSYYKFPSVELNT